MLFNSVGFLLFFGMVCLVFHLAARSGLGRWLVVVLSVSSLVFYSWWNVDNIPVLVLSIFVNYIFGEALHRNRSRLMLGFGVAFNLLLLSVFKYTSFAIHTANSVFGANLPEADIAMVLGVSFFTFHQIIYIVEIYRGTAEPKGFWPYCLYVTFFPQLIAGPIVRYNQVIGQFDFSNRRGIDRDDFAVGITVFVIGLSKKILLADWLGPIATPVFQAADEGQAVGFFSAWIGVLAYTLQIYFDFSGYSEMAIGLSRIFGVTFPINFNSPYLSTSIIEFWRRWHISLSDFLRRYLYYPLGGSRQGLARQCVNIMVVMLLGGLWHGAGWTFVCWGGLHGGMIVINHLGRRWLARLWPGGRVGVLLGWMLTMLGVVAAWIFFRASTFAGAWTLLKGMTLVNGIDVPRFVFGQAAPVVLTEPAYDLALVVLAGLVVLVTPNVRRLMAPTEIALVQSPSFDIPPPVGLFRLQWHAAVVWGVATGTLFFSCLLAMVSHAPTEFLYFQF